MARKITGIIITAILAAAFALPCSAGALQAGSFGGASLPYVDDVNEWGASSYILTVYAAGNPSACKATSKGKALKVKRHGKRVWTVVVKRRAYVRLSVRAKGGAWKSIGYRVY